jgi:Na+/pantothenate symporter
MKNTKQEKRIKDLETLVVLGIASIFFYLVFKVRALLFLTVAFLLIGVTIKSLASLIADVWLNFSHVIGSINSRIILTVVFYTLLTPLAFLYRIFSKNPMMLKKDVSSSSFFFDRNHSFAPEEFERTW